MLPWGEMLRAGQALGVSAPAFWALSLREWRWLAAREAASAMAPETLADLIAQFPDEVPGKEI